MSVQLTPVVEYDATVDAAYIRFSTEEIAESEEVATGIVLDYDETGRIVGMEVLDARKNLPPAMLNKAA
ncbi:MAG: DUF2283 domain-containing protein [Neorhizobium sp.]|nr:DUF2283 domain-containing protein [Neorhizobium sp.]